MVDIEVKPSDTVGNLKAKIEDEEPHTRNCILIPIYGGKELDKDERTLADCDVRNYCRIHVVCESWRRARWKRMLDAGGYHGSCTQGRQGGLEEAPSPPPAAL